MSTITTIAEPKARLPLRVATDLYSLRRFSVAEYHSMLTSGILHPDERVELLYGWIVKKMGHNPPHSSTVTRIMRFLLRILDETWSIRVQCPITLTNSEPEPDIVIAHGPDDLYVARHPRPRDIALAMEVGDSTLLADRRDKGTMYAEAKIVQFWLVNLVDRKIEVFTKPRAGRVSYQKVVPYMRDETIPLVLDGLKIADIPVSELIAKS